MSILKSEVSVIRGCGASAATLRSAFAAAKGGYVYVIDGDVAGNEAKLDRFLARMEETGADVVVGTKRSPRWRNRVYYAFVRLLFGLPISDTQTGARLYRRETLGYALDRALSKTGAFDLELLTIAAGHGAKIAEVEIPEQLSPSCGASVSRRFVRSTLNDTLAIFYRARILGYYSKCLVPTPLDHEPTVSVVIACPGDSWMLRECLAALARQTYRAFEVIVLPDGDLDLGSRDMDVRVLPTGKVRPAEKRNLGIREAKGEIVAFIDDDAYPEAHWLEHAVRYFGEPSIGGVGGPGVTPPGDRYLSKLGGRVYDNILVSGNYRYRYRAGGVRMDTEDYPSCNLFVRTELLKKIGGYRTDFWPGEDTLLCKDIVDNWKRIIYDPWIVVYHHRRPLLGPHLRQLGRYGFHRGYFCKRYPSNSLRLSYFIPTLFVLYLLTWPLVFFLAPDRMPALVFGLWAAYLSLPVLLYAGLVFLTTFALNPLSWLVTAAGVVASHVTYGIQFFRGITAKRAPCEFIGKDHGTAKRTLAGVFLLSAFLLAAPPALAKPNVVFVLTDDLGYGDVGWAWQTKRSVGEARILTPNLDRLAHEGVILTDHYCAAPVCAPSRASILTGVKQDRCSVRDNMFDHPLAEPETLGTVMKRGGYRTMAIGKWGVGGGGESKKPVTAHPLDKGFDSYYGFMDHMAGHTYYHYEGFINGAYMGLWNGREKVTKEGEGIYSTDLFIARAKKEIEDAVREDPKRPFFLYLAVNAIHGSGRCDGTLANRHPLHVPGRPYPKEGVTWPLAPEPLERRNTWIDPRYRSFANENMRRYATAISRLDDAMADLMRHLGNLGVAENTIVIFTSDNGPTDEYGTDTRFFQSAGPFDGMKRDVYEGGMRVPTFVWRQGGFGAKADASPSISWDWMPTLAEIAGVATPAQCDGVSLWNRWFKGGKWKPSKIETAYRGFKGWEPDFKEFAARKHNLVRGEQKMRREGDIVELQAGGKDKPWRRYDVRKDPHQDHDLNER